MAPAVPMLFHDTDLGREFRILEVLSGAGLAVPTPRWLELDQEVLGGPFLVMDRVDGVVPADDPPHTTTGWVTDLPAERRGELYRHTIDFVRQIQELDWKGLGLDFLDRPESGARTCNDGLRGRLGPGVVGDGEDRDLQDVEAGGAPDD